MHNFRKIAGATILGVAMAGMIGAVQATPVTVQGVNWDTDKAGSDPDFTGRFSFVQWFKDNATGNPYKNPSSVVAGDQLAVFGEFFSWNGIQTDSSLATGGGASSFCVGCELTFSLTGLVADGSGDFTFSGAKLLFYSDNHNDFDPSDLDLNNSAGIASSATNMTAGYTEPFLELSVDDLTFTALPGPGGVYSGGQLTINFSATGGAAKDLFDTNGYSNGTITWDLFSTGSAIFQQTEGKWIATSTGQIIGDTRVIPEPASLALVSLGLLGFGASRRRKVVAA